MPAIGQGNLILHRAFRAMVTVGEMMEDRGYVVAADTIPSDFNDFMDRYVSKDSNMNQMVRREKMMIACERRHHGTAADRSGSAATTFDSSNLHSSAAAERATVVFVPTPDFTVKALNTLVKQASDTTGSSSWRFHSLICVLTVKPNLMVRRAAEAINRSSEMKVELFDEDDLAINITHHELVPKHTPLTDKEVEELTVAYAVQKHQLPRILSSDPVAAYFGLERGQVVRIERKSVSAGVYVTYRQVV